MVSNAPPFDPIEATPEEEAQMMAGYLAAWRGQDLPPLAGVAFSHGYRMARNDKAGVVYADQRELTLRFLAKQRAARAPVLPLAEGGEGK